MIETVTCDTYWCHDETERHSTAHIHHMVLVSFLVEKFVNDG